MSDREMLEFAAKAAGIDAHWGDGWQSHMMFRALPRPNSPLVANVEWNPLTDDGDALRLAVKLRIDLLLWIYTDSVLAQTSIGVGRGIPLQGEYVRPVNDHKEPKGNDPFAATRRAIVRAAAEIGRQMP